MESRQAATTGPSAPPAAPPTSPPTAPPASPPTLPAPHPPPGPLALEDGKLQSATTLQPLELLAHSGKLLSRSLTPTSRDSRRGSLLRMRARPGAEDAPGTPRMLEPPPATEGNPGEVVLVVHARPNEPLLNKRSSLSSERSSDRSFTPPSILLRRSKSRHPSDSGGEAACPSSESSSSGNLKQGPLQTRLSVEEELKVSLVGYNEGDEKSEAERSASHAKLTSFHSASTPDIPRYRQKDKGSVCAVGPIRGTNRHWLPIPPRPRVFESVRLERHSVAMRDGVLLAVDVYIPTKRSNLASSSSSSSSSASSSASPSSFSPSSFSSSSSNSTSLPTVLHFTRFNRDWSFKKGACCWSSLLCCCCCGCCSGRLGMSGYPGLGHSHWNIRTGQQVSDFCSAGYVWMTVDVRGTGASQGSRPYDLHPDELADMADIAAWVEAQPWSSGKIVSTGADYDGFLTALLSTQHLSSVMAVAPLFLPFDLYDEALYPGGIRCCSFLAPYQQLTSNLERNTPAQADLSWLMRVLLHTVVGGASPGRGGQSEMEDAIRAHARNYDVSESLSAYINRDDPFLSLPSVDAISLHTAVIAAGYSPTALLLICGWLDGGNALGAIRWYTTAEQMWLRQHLGHRPRLVIGPWGRKPKLETEAKARFPMNAELLRFFANKTEVEEGESKAMLGVKNEVPVHYFTTGEERWKASTVWPPPHQMLRLDLAQNKAGLRLKILKDLAGKSMREELTSDNKALSFGTHEATQWRCDFRATSGPTSRWAFPTSEPPSIMYPNRAIQDQHNLVYDSSPLPSLIEVTGHPFATLYLATDVKDACVFVYLEERRANGSVAYVTEGQLRLSHRAIGVTEGPYLSPVPYRSYASANRSNLDVDIPYKIIIPLLPCSHQFSVGSRVRLSIASADTDNFDPIPEPSPSVFTIFHRHSYLNLPVVKPMT